MERSIELHVWMVGCMDVCTLTLLLPSLQLSFLSHLPSSFLPFISTFHSNLQSYILGSISPGGKHNGRQNAEYKPGDHVFKELPNHSENKIRALSHRHHSFFTPSPAFIVCRFFFFFLDDGHSDRYEVIIIVVLICISLIMNLLSTFSCAFFFKLGYSCFAILCYFLLCNRVNQLFVYVYLLHFEPSSHHSTTISSL